MLLPMNTSMNAKVGWGIAAAVVVIALIAYAVYESQTPIAPLNTVATSTDLVATSTSPTAPITSAFPSAVPAVTHATSTGTTAPSVMSDGTIVYTYPSKVTIPLSKTAIEKQTGFRITLNKITTKKETPVSQPKSTVAYITVNTGSCSGGTCTARQDTAQNIAFSVGQSLNYGAYNIALLSLNASTGTFAITDAKQ